MMTYTGRKQTLYHAQAPRENMTMMQTIDDENLKILPEIQRKEIHDVVLLPVIDAETHSTSRHRTRRCD